MAGQDATFTTTGATPISISSESAVMLNDFWTKVSADINTMNNSSFKTHELPLARIKKIMKLDEDVKMISAEAPVLFAKAAEIFISELSLRAWVHTEDNKRRTLQRNDIAMAISKFDQFDFLIDIVPREELKPAKRQEDNVRTTSMMADQVQYYFQLAQQATGNVQQTAQTTAQSSTVQASPAQVTQATTQALANQLQVQAGQQILQQPFQIQLGQTAQTQQVSTNTGQGQTQVIQVQAPAQQQQQQQQQQQIQLQQTQPAQQLQQQTTQVFQQVVTPSGEVQNVPIQLTPAQFQAIQLQLQGKQSTQPIVIQTPQAQPTEPTVQFAASQPMFQIQQLPNGQQVYIQHSAQGGGDGTEQQTVVQDTT